LETTLLQKDEKTDWKSLGKKKALKYNNLRAIFVNFCGERGTTFELFCKGFAENPGLYSSLWVKFSDLEIRKSYPSAGIIKLLYYVS